MEMVLEALHKEIKFVATRIAKIQSWMENFVENAPEPLPNLSGMKTDSLLPEIIKQIRTQKYISASYIQRKFATGYARAARILDELQATGYIGEAKGSKPRLVLKK